MKCVTERCYCIFLFLSSLSFLHPFCFSVPVLLNGHVLIASARASERASPRCPSLAPPSLASLLPLHPHSSNRRTSSLVPLVRRIHSSSYSNTKRVDSPTVVSEPSLVLVVTSSSSRCRPLPLPPLPALPSIPLSHWRARNAKCRYNNSNCNNNMLTCNALWQSIRSCRHASSRVSV